MSDDPYKYFRIEARELVDSLTHGRPRPGEGTGRPGPGRRGCCGLPHTLKGAARVVKQTGIADPATPSRTSSPTRADSSRKRCRRTASRQLLAADRRDRGRPCRSDADCLDGGDSPGAGGSDRGRRRAGPRAEEQFETVRVDVAGHGRAAADRIGAVVQVLSGLSRQAGEIQQVAQTRGQTAPRRGSQPACGGGRPLVRRESRTWSSRSVSASRGLSANATRADRRHPRLYEQAAAMRLVPAASLFAAAGADRFAMRPMAWARTWRSRPPAANATRRPRRSALLRHALVQLVRNAVAHGIEAPAERQGGRQAGRRAACRCRCSAAATRPCSRAATTATGSTWTRCGRSSSARRLATAEQARDARRAAADGPAVPRRHHDRVGVSQLSGRGIGLDVVREASAALNGTVNAWSEPGTRHPYRDFGAGHVESQGVLQVDAAGGRLPIPLRGREAHGSADGSPTSPVAGRREHPRRRPGACDSCRLAASASARRRSRAPPRSRRWCSRPARSTAAIGVDRVLRHEQVVVRSMPAILGPTPMRGRGVPRQRGRPADWCLTRGTRPGGPSGSPPAGPRRAAATPARAGHRRLADHAHAGAGDPGDGRLRGGYGLVRRGGAREGQAAALRRVHRGRRDARHGRLRVHPDCRRRTRPAGRCPSILVTSRDSPEDRASGDRRRGEGLHRQERVRRGRCCCGPFAS